MVRTEVGVRRDGLRCGHDEKRFCDYIRRVYPQC